jgi:hypothetical protein
MPLTFAASVSRLAALVGLGAAGLGLACGVPASAADASILLSLCVTEWPWYRALKQGLGRADDTFLQQQVQRALRRYLAAIMMIPLVRHLDLLSLQVNVGE